MATDPLPSLFDAIGGYQRSAALRAAVELDVFTAIAEGTDAVPALAARCQAAERGVRILCDTLAAHGYLRKDGGRYGLDPELAPFLDGHSPACIVRAASFMASPAIWRAFGDLAAAVRRGGTALGTQEATAVENPIWVEDGGRWSGAPSASGHQDGRSAPPSHGAAPVSVPVMHASRRPHLGRW